jgi:glutaredoxin
VKEFLSQQGRPFLVRNVDEDDEAYDDLIALGHRSVPVTVIGSAVVAGYDRASLVNALEAVG